MSALSTALKGARDDSLKVEVGDHTGNMEIGRELGMDSSMHDAQMSLLALTEPTEYLALKNADLAEIKTNLEKPIQDHLRQILGNRDVAI